MSAAAVRFEIFDPGDVAEFGALSQNAALKQACDAAYQQGYRDAEATAGSKRTSDRAVLLARISECADDFSLSGTEARAAVLRTLRPLIVRITGAVLPACARAGLAREIADVAADLTDQAMPATLCIDVAPDHEAAIREALEQAGIASKVRGDATLTGQQARISTGEGWEQLDLGDAAETALRMVENFFDAAEEGFRNAG